jgi:hypothetical protein
MLILYMGSVGSGQPNSYGLACAMVNSSKEGLQDQRAVVDEMRIDVCCMTYDRSEQGGSRGRV